MESIPDRFQSAGICISTTAAGRKRWRALRIKPSTVSVSIERMEKNGLIVRKRDAMHPRIVKVYVTEKLRGCYRTFGEILEKNEKTIMKGFTEEEKEQLQGYLNRIFSNLEQGSKKSGGCCGQEEV